MKKCPNCGSDVPIENNTCNQCGYSFSGKSGTTFTSVKGGSQGSYDDVFSKIISHSAKGKIGKFFSAIVLSHILFVIVLMIIYVDILFSRSKYEYDGYYTCYSLCGEDDYVKFKDSCICENDNIYNVNNGEMIYDSSLNSGFGSDAMAKCRVFCEENVNSYNSYSCYCDDGRMYNLDGEEIFEEVVGNSRTVNQWFNDVVGGKDVVTVFCENGNRGCVIYKEEMYALASKYNLNYYYFNLDLLDERERIALTETYDLPYYKSSGGYVPYTFVMRNGNVAYQLKGRNTMEYVENFFIRYDVIKK